MDQVRVAVACDKGGVGKTSVSTGLGSVFAHCGKRTLVIDFDPQSNVATGFGKVPDAPGTAELLLGERPEHIEIAENLRMLPGGPRLDENAIQDLEADDLLDAVGGFEYDVIVFDCPPGNPHLERMALAASTRTLAVTNAHVYGVNGVQRVINKLVSRRERGRKGPDSWAIVMNQLDRRRGADRDLEGFLRRTFPATDLFPVRQDISLAAAQQNGVPIMKFSPSGGAVDDLRQIAEWVNG